MKPTYFLAMFRADETDPLSCLLTNGIRREEALKLIAEANTRDRWTLMAVIDEKEPEPYLLVAQDPKGETTSWHSYPCVQFADLDAASIAMHASIDAWGGTWAVFESIPPAHH
jgi:hypothetical protein